MKLSTQLLQYLAKHGDWIPKPEILKMQWKNKNGTTPTAETVGRELRDLETLSLIARKKYGKTIQYKFLPDDERMLRRYYVPYSDRINKELLFKK